MRKRSLGRGLSQLLSGDAPPESRAVVEIALAEIRPNPRQPRQMGEMLDDVELEQLAQSIEAHGILQPVIVRRRGEGYELVAGERRWRAAKLLSLPTMPCIVQDIDDHTALQIALVENLQREDLNEMEVAVGYRVLIDEFGATQEEVAQHVGKSRSAVTNALRLLDLPTEIQEMVREGTLSAGHGRALLGLGREDMEGLVRVAESVVGQGMSVRETEQLVRDLLSFRDLPEEDDARVTASPSTGELRDPHFAEAEERLQSLLATRVVIKRRAKGGGTIEIRYYDDDDLSRIVDELEASGHIP